MMGQNRMSPLTALVIGVFGIGAVGIASGSAIVLYGMRIININASAIVGLAENTVEGLPELIESLPPALGDLFNDRRAPDYASQIDVAVRLVPHDRRDGLRPVLTVTNNGSKVISLLGVRVAALNESNAPVREWSEMVATPLPIEGEWRGPLYPGSTRHVLVSGRPTITEEQAEKLTVVTEISEIRVWLGHDG